MISPVTAAAPLVVAAAPSSTAPSGPPSHLEVPEEFAARLDAALALGRTEASAFASEHTPAERQMIADWALLRMGWPPKTDDEDLAYLHRVASTRTKQGVEAAQYWASHGLEDVWERLLDDYTSKVGPAQARAARKLLHDALTLTNEATQDGKAAAARKRPFVVDPTLETAIDRPGNNPSYPSGHTSAAYAAAIVLSHLMPDRKAEFLGLAREASWARVYGGVHFPTDVLAGAKVAATVTSYLVTTSLARPKRGTARHAAAGSGARTALPGATLLQGPRLANAGTLTPAA